MNLNLEILVNSNMIRTESSVFFLESQLIEIDNILKYSRDSIIYERRRKVILKKLAFLYMRSKFKTHENTIEIMSEI